MNMKSSRSLLWNLRVSWALLVVLLGTTSTRAQDPLQSWNDGPAKQAILAFVKDTTEKSSPKYVEPADRIATFDQDGTLWTEHPLYAQGYVCAYARSRVGAETSGVETEGAVQVGACRRPCSHGQVHRRGLDADCRCDACRYEHRSLSGARERLARQGQSPALRPAVYRSHLSAHAGGDAVSARQRVQDLHRHRRRAGVCARLQRTSVWRSTGTGGGIKHRHDLRQ